MTEAQLQRYRVIGRLAQGGMAEVFLAENAGIEGFKKQVAIKRVLPHLSEKKKFIAMFLDEARLSARLSHSNVVSVFDIGVGDGTYFIVMEYVDGADLKAVIEFMRKSGRAFPVEAACFIAEKICEGLGYAHEMKGPDGKDLKIVHRDMSPPNVLITKYGEVKIVDFGLAKATSQLEKSEAGIIKGKFSYLSPEAALGDEVDQRADVFAVGIILWEMLAGRRLFLGETDFATVKMVQKAQIPKIEPPIPKELEAILMRALAREPDDRYPSARALGRDLTAFLFKYGRPVNALDVADLVRGAMELRKISQPDRASTIDKLIEEVRLDFTSLQRDERDGRARRSMPKLDDAPRLSGFEDISKWADELGGMFDQPSDGAASEGSTKQKAAGGDEPAPSSREKSSEPASASDASKPVTAAGGVSAAAASSTALVAGATSPATVASQGRRSGALMAVIVLAVLGLAAAAWFGGLIPR